MNTEFVSISVPFESEVFMDSRLRGNDVIGWTHCTLV
jgi:hypothetical protein